LIRSEEKYYERETPLEAQTRRIIKDYIITPGIQDLNYILDIPSKIKKSVTDYFKKE
jgi:hypothetical protein